MKLRLRNFQGHEDSTIETVPGITAITGSTNSGKTSIIRAVSHLKNNNLLGTAYIRKGTDCCTIELDEISRVKSKTDNCYLLDGNKTEALRGGVPIEVSRSLNLSDDCIQMQHDSIYLLNKSPGVVASKLAELVDLEVAHKAVKIVDKDRREVFAEINACASIVKKCDERIVELEVLPEVDQALASIERKQAVLADCETKQASLRKTVENAVVRLTELNSIPNVHSLAGCQKLMAKVSECIADQGKLRTLKITVEALKDRTAELAELQSITKLKGVTALTKQFGALAEDAYELEAVKGAVKAAKVAFSKLIKIPNNILPEAVEAVIEEQALTVRLSSQIGIAIKTAKEIQEHTNSLTALQATYKKTLGNKCPLCLGDIK
jgi:DNA repair protein SbcC/Rad50